MHLNLGQATVRGARRQGGWSCVAALVAALVHASAFALDIESYWEYGNPAASEARFRGLLVRPHDQRVRLPGSGRVFFFDEFDARFNLVAFDYLVYPAEVFVDIWEAYPVVPGVLGSLALAGIVTWALRPWLLPVDQPDSSLRQRLAPFAVLHRC